VTGDPVKGAALLAGEWAGHVSEQTRAFLRDYRTPAGSAEQPGPPN
jgi:hypothetical protein